MPIVDVENKLKKKKKIFNYTCLLVSMIKPMVFSNDWLLIST